MYKYSLRTFESGDTCKYVEHAIEGSRDYSCLNKARRDGNSDHSIEREVNKVEVYE